MARTITASGSGVGSLLRAAAPSVPGLNQLPGVRKRPVEDLSTLTAERLGARIERDAVERYAEVCGFARKDTAPVTYPHMLAFGLHMGILTDPGFPFPAIGTVHIENSITSHRPLAIGETVDVRVHASGPRTHEKGTLVDFLTEVVADGETVWESTSTYLRRGKGDAAAEPGLQFSSELPPTGSRWKLPSNLGRQYAAVSGDRNPIHLYPYTAKALGFPRHIAHGMWSKARCLAAVENRLPDGVRIEVAFKKPILLPGTVAFGARPGAVADSLEFALSRPRDGAPHLAGRTLPL